MDHSNDLMICADQSTGVVIMLRKKNVQMMIRVSLEESESEEYATSVKKDRKDCTEDLAYVY